MKQIALNEQDYELKVYYKTTLIFYDRIQLFQANGLDSSNYIAFAIDDNLFIMIKVTLNDLNGFFKKRIDLRDLIIFRNIRTWYEVSFDTNIEDPLIIKKTHETDVMPKKNVPKAGFFLT